MKDQEEREWWVRFLNGRGFNVQDRFRTYEMLAEEATRRARAEAFREVEEIARKESMRLREQCTGEARVMIRSIISDVEDAFIQALKGKEV